MNDSKRLVLLDRFARAWNAHDVDALLSMVTPDCIYDASTGPHLYGARYQGHDELRRAFVGVWTAVPDAQWQDARHQVWGDRGLSEWTFLGTRKSDGTRVDSQGIDLFLFRGDLIAHKDTFRKMVLAQ
jgi:ketosteroid isomerase-like protein